MRSEDKSVYAEIGRRIREIPYEKTSASYEWEELVQKLYASDDIELHAIGEKEFDRLRK